MPRTLNRAGLRNGHARRRPEHLRLGFLAPVEPNAFPRGLPRWSKVQSDGTFAPWGKEIDR
eukprot:263308-Amphidinium_carterae.1